MKKLIFSFATITLAVASAASYNVTIFEPVQAGDRQLQPGTYKVKLKDNAAVFSRGSKSIEAPARIENGDMKFRTTSTTVRGSELEEIHFRGTTTKVVFAAPEGAPGQQ